MGRSVVTADKWLDYIGTKIMPVTETGCWIWLGSLNRLGYGKVGFKHKTIGAHRVSYFLLRGPIPEGLTLDHLCRQPSCVNPAHLEAVTQRENVMRGRGISAKNARKTHCKHGHEFTTENTYGVRGRRQCRACSYANSHKQWKKRQAAARLIVREPQTHCYRGHPLSGGNLYIYRGCRSCKTCKIENQRAWRAGKP